MKKQNIILIIIAVIIVVLIAFLFLNNKNNGVLETESDIKNMLNTIINKNKNDLPSLEVMTMETDKDTVNLYTGLKDNNSVELLIVAEPMMNAQAFSVVILKVKEGSNIESIKEEIYENINMSKWICVTAEKLNITNNGNTIFVVMADNTWANIMYNGFKDYVNNDLGKELEKNNTEEIILPDEMLTVE